ncbi:unnamed protein product [Prunus armeniaca]
MLPKRLLPKVIGVVLKLNAGPNWAKSQKTVQLPPNDFGSVEFLDHFSLATGCFDIEAQCSGNEDKVTGSLGRAAGHFDTVALVVKE